MDIAVNGITLNWDETGEGTPLLWLRGGTGCGADWRVKEDSRSRVS